jgi:hypothetical protein
LATLAILVAWMYLVRPSAKAEPRRIQGPLPET